MTPTPDREEPTFTAETGQEDSLPSQARDEADPSRAEDLTPDQAKAAQDQLGELQEQVLRARADAENTRRRADEEVSKARKFAIESFAQSMLFVRDSLEMALNLENQTPEKLREGVEATLRQLCVALEQNKVLEIAPAAGDRFDPHRHQAISVVPSEQAANTVVGVLQKGYAIADRVLRPALVTVAGAS